MIWLDLSGMVTCNCYSKSVWFDGECDMARWVKRIWDPGCVDNCYGYLDFRIIVPLYNG